MPEMKGIKGLIEMEIGGSPRSSGSLRGFLQDKCREYNPRHRVPTGEGTEISMKERKTVLRTAWVRPQVTSAPAITSLPPAVTELAPWTEPQSSPAYSSADQLPLHLFFATTSSKRLAPRAITRNNPLFSPRLGPPHFAPSLEWLASVANSRSFTTYSSCLLLFHPHFLQTPLRRSSSSLPASFIGSRPLPGHNNDGSNASPIHKSQSST